jgi:putative transposase
MAAMDDDAKRAIALFRLGVLDPLVSARLEHGDRIAYFVEAASRRHVLPADDRIVRLSARTIEAWYYLHKHGGFEALIPDPRADKGQSRAIRAEVAEVIVRANDPSVPRPSTCDRLTSICARPCAIDTPSLAPISLGAIISRHGGGHPVRRLRRIPLLA